MEKRHFSLNEDERKDILAKAIVSFLLIGMGVSFLLFFSIDADSNRMRWEQYIEYFGRVVNPAWVILISFFIMWLLALVEHWQYMKLCLYKKSQGRVLLNKVADKMYDLFPRSFFVMGGCIFSTCILEFFFLPYNCKMYFYLIIQFVICVIAFLVAFKMLLPRRLMLNILIIRWFQLYYSIKEIWVITINRYK